VSGRIEQRIRFVEAAGVRLRAVLDGEGPPIVVLHGFTGDAESMESVAQGLGREGRRCVVRLELIGHGESAAPGAVAPYAFSACVEQVAAAVRALKLGKPDLLGYSMGGRVALATGLAHPELFSTLVLVGATAGIDDPARREDRIAADRALADRIEARGVERFVDEWMALPIFASQARLGPAALQRARVQRLRNRAHALAHSLRGMGAGAQPPLHDRLPGLDLPVLLVVGEEDAKFRAIAGGLERLLPDARTVVIPRAGHAAHLESPVEFARVVSDFLSGASDVVTRCEPAHRRPSRSSGGES
jgi:2-succinyl-6-hydroxy-2,4-cyclohexadiene-1-carboxylate synthase